jgi:hypothetical protein
MSEIKAIQKVRNFAASVLFGAEPKALTGVEQGQVYGLLVFLKKAIDARLKEIKPVLVGTIRAEGVQHTAKSEKLEFEGGSAMVTVSPAAPDTEEWDEKAIKSAAAMFDLDLEAFFDAVQPPPPPPVKVVSQAKVDALVKSGKIPASAAKKFRVVKKGKAESYTLTVTLDQEIQADIMGRLGNGK